MKVFSLFAFSLLLASCSSLPTQEAVSREPSSSTARIAKTVDTVTDPAHDILTVCREGKWVNGKAAQIAVVNIDPVTRVATLDMPGLRRLKHKILSFGNVMQKAEDGMAYVADVKVEHKDLRENPDLSGVDHRDLMKNTRVYPDGNVVWDDGWKVGCYPVQVSQCAKIPFDGRKLCVGDRMAWYGDTGPTKVTKLFSIKDGDLAAFSFEGDDDFFGRAEGRGEWVWSWRNIWPGTDIVHLP